MLLAPPTPGQRDALRTTLLAAGRLPLYAEAFARAGVTERCIRADPVGALQALPVFAAEAQSRLAQESLAERSHDLGGLEISSGTGGASKRRVLSEEDVALDGALLARLFRVAGVEPGDRVVAVELAVTPLAAAFLEGCERLGVRDSVALAWRPGSDPQPLRRLAPSVLIAPPSLLEQMQPPLPGVRLVIYNGDHLAEPVARRLGEQGIGVRSLYGLTETSALGVSCVAEGGIHLAPRHALHELRPVEAGLELIVTTLGFSMPLLRYPTADRVRPLPGRCRCRVAWPRIDLLGRLGARFAVFEVETSVDDLRTTLDLTPHELLQVELTDSADGGVRMSLHLPAATRGRWPAMRARLRDHPLLGYLVATRLLQVRLRTQKQADARKRALLLDRRLARGRPNAG